jgi:RNA polymerase sigma-70 factor (ECF subfamily)
MDSSSHDRLNKNGDDNFESLLQPHLEYIYRISYRFTGNKGDAEDLVQDLLVKLYPRRESLHGVARLRPWLIRVLYRLFIDNMRKQKRFPLGLISNRADNDDGHLVEQIPDDNPDPEEYAQKRMVFENIEKALTMLGKDQRAVIALHDIEGYTLAELETLLEIPLGTLKSRLHRARGKLREILQKNGTF